MRLGSLFEVRGALPVRTRIVVAVAALLVIAGIWSALTYSGRVSGLILPTPTQLGKSAVELLTPPEGKGFLAAPLLDAILVSLARTLKALGLTALIAVPVGILMGSFPFFDVFFGAPVSAVKAIPATAFLGLLIMAYGIEERAKIAFLVIGAVFFMILMVRAAVLNVRAAYVQTATDIGVNRWQMIWHVLLPGALPEIWDALIISNGIMWTYIVIAEYTNPSGGLGALIYSAGKVYDIGRIWVSILTIAVVAVGTDSLLRWLQRVWFPWKDR